jgi:hypothetical protein
MKKLKDIFNVTTGFKKLYLIVFLMFILLSCRKDVTLELPEYQQKVVIEASIETGYPALVLLSWSVPYFGDFDYTAPQEAFIKSGIVTLTDGYEIETLKELDPNTGYFYAGSKILGVEGRSYTLTVTVNDKTFSTSTSILKPAKLDSLFFKGEKDTLGFIWQTFTEPPGSGDAYRWFAKRLGRDELYAAPFGSVFDDKFIDGKTFDFAYDRGPQPNQVQQYRDDPERGFYKRGDTVVVKLCKIGRREYDFWNTYYQNKLSNSNPFSAPANIKSMFSDYEDAFGAFTGYAPSYDTIVIPEL